MRGGDGLRDGRGPFARILSYPTTRATCWCHLCFPRRGRVKSHPDPHSDGTRRADACPFAVTETQGDADTHCCSTYRGVHADTHCCSTYRDVNADTYRYASYCDADTYCSTS